MTGHQYPLKMLVVFMIYAPIPMILADFKVEQLQREMMTPDKFGPIKVRLANMFLCKGPKRKNCTDDVRIETVDQSPHRYRNATFRQTFSKHTLFLKTKMVINRLNKDSVSIPGITKIVEKPCNQFFLGPILKKYFNVTAPRCTVAKGNYISNANCDEMLLELMGFQFFYGVYRGQILLLSTDCNVFCIAVDFVLDPKDVNKSKRK